jgi:hypothetical protein
MTTVYQKTKTTNRTTLKKQNIQLCWQQFVSIVRLHFYHYIGLYDRYYVVSDRMNLSHVCKTNCFFRLMKYDIHSGRRSIATLWHWESVCAFKKKSFFLKKKKLGISTYIWRTCSIFGEMITRNIIGTLINCSVVAKFIRKILKISYWKFFSHLMIKECQI